MTVSTFIDLLSQESGVILESRLYTALDLAMVEFRDVSDYLLREIAIEPPAGLQVITLPWYVSRVRAVKPQAGKRYELNTPQAGYLDGAYQEYTESLTVLEPTVLDVSISSATRLTLEKAGSETNSITVTLGGPTTIAAFASETVELVASQQLTKTYLDLTVLSKTELNEVDIFVKDAKGSQISMLPNCLKTAPRQRIRTPDFYSGTGYPINVLYVPPLILAAGSNIPDEYIPAILYKCQEILNLPEIAKKDPSVYSVKSQGAFLVASDAINRGKTFRPPVQERFSAQGYI